MWRGSELNDCRRMRAAATWQAGHPEHRVLSWPSLRHQFPRVLSTCFKLNTELQGFLNTGLERIDLQQRWPEQTQKAGTIYLHSSCTHFSMSSLCSLQVSAAQTYYTLLLIGFWVFKPPLPVASNLLQFTRAWRLSGKSIPFQLLTSSQKPRTRLKLRNRLELIHQQQGLIKIFSSTDQPWEVTTK